MGCDFFYSGKLSNPVLQKMVIYLIKSYYSETHEISPLNHTTFFTRISQKNKGQNREPGSWPSERPYPFNFFGVIPYSGLINYRTGQNHFIFDRTAGGELVTLTKLPDPFTPSGDQHQERDFFDSDDTIEVKAESGGYCRMVSGAMTFSLLLHIIRLRYWPDFSFCDDYDVSIDTARLIKEFQLESTLKSWRYKFEDCRMLFWKKYERHFPSTDEEETPFPAPAPRLTPLLYDFQNIPIDEVEFSVRSSRFLKKAGIKTVGELATYSPKVLCFDKKFGRKSLNEIIETLWQCYGVHLRPD